MPPAERASAAGPVHSAWARAVRRADVRGGGAILLLLVGAAVLAPWLGTVDPLVFDPASRNLGPGSHGEIATVTGQLLPRRFPLGSDALGRDLYSRVLYGARASLAVCFATAALAALAGLLVGLAAGFARALDGPLMRAMDALMAVPALLVAVTLVALWRGGLVVVVLSIALTELPGVARLVRAVVLGVRGEAYVAAAVTAGLRPWRVALTHVLPAVWPTLAVQASFIAATALVTESVMSFLGVGLPPDVASWGGLLAEARSHFGSHLHNLYVPGAALVLAVLGIQLLGEGLARALEPGGLR